METYKCQNCNNEMIKQDSQNYAGDLKRILNTYICPNCNTTKYEFENIE